MSSRAFFGGGRMLDTREAARALRMSESALRRRCYDGTIPYSQVGARGRIWISESALVALGLDSGRLAAQAREGGAK